MNLTLSELPPPLSACFNNVGQSRVKSKRYKNWGAHAYFELTRQSVLHHTITVPVIVTYMVKRKRNKDGSVSKVNQDLDNLCKGLGDVLTDARIINDDSLIHDLRIAWSSPDQTKAVEIVIQLM